MSQQSGNQTGNNASSPTSANETWALDIEVVDGKKTLVHQVMDQSKIIIGRIFSADLRISDSRISRIHALLERLDDGTLRLTDLASTHGTFVNSQRIVERIISTNDEVALSTLKFKIKFVRVQPKADTTVQEPVTVTKAPPAKKGTKPKIPKTSKEPVDEPAVQSTVQIDVGGPAVSVPGVRKGDPTVIRSLKETARTRGVLDPAGPTDELELTVYWEETILAVDHFKRMQKSIHIGDGPHNDYIVASGFVPDHFHFLKIRGRSVELNIHPTMKGSVRVQGRMQTLEEFQKAGTKTIVLSGQDIAKIRVGSVNFFLMFVPEPPAIPYAPLFDQGGTFWAFQSTVLALCAAIVALGLLFKQPIEGKVVEMPEKLRRILIEEYEKDIQNAKVNDDDKDEEKIEEVKNPTLKGTTQKDVVKNPDAQMVDKETKFGGNEGEGAREKGKEGKRGRPNAKNETGITNRPKVPGATRTQDAQQKAKVPNKAPGTPSLIDSLKNTGLAAQLAKVSGAGAGGGGGGSQGNDPLKQAFSGVGGGGIRDGRGSGGSGLQGTGTGGGGKAEGIGGLGTKGFGGGAKGTGNGSIPGKGEFAIGTEAAEIQIMGSLTREEVKRVVDAHANEIHFCYQREQQRDPSISGKISYRWTVIDQGFVSIVKSVGNATGSQSLENCIRDKIKNWVFPSPAKGSSADVDYGWTFKPKAM